MVPILLWLFRVNKGTSTSRISMVGDRREGLKGYYVIESRNTRGVGGTDDGWL